MQGMTAVELGDELVTDLEEELAVASKPRFNGELGNIVEEVRAIFRLFHKSPSLNDEFNEYVEEASSTLKLVLDVKTRWNSSLRMLKNFIRLSSAIKELYSRNQKRGAFSLTHGDLVQVEHVVLCLEHVEVPSKRLSEDDITLRMADIAVEMLIEGLKSIGSQFAEDLCRSVCIRMLQRRGVASRLSRYLRKRDVETDMDKWLEEVRNGILTNRNKKLSESFLDPGSLKYEIASFMRSRSSVAGELLPSTGNRFEELKNRDKEERPRFADATAESLMELHRGGVRSFPEELYELMGALQPTSVPAERAFSKARHARRSNQESQGDKRFEEYLLLKNVFAAERPWDAYFKGNKRSPNTDDKSDSDSHDEGKE